jgi:hypothetical protein
MRNMLVKLATVGMLLLGGAASALAGSVTQPGETVGLATGAPLPQGLYFVNTGDWGNRSGVDTSLGVDIPVIAWSTPWMILGGRVQFLLAGPLVEVGVHRTTYLRGVYNPLVAGQLAWDLGNNWGFSYLLGAYLDINSEVAWSSTSLNQRFALSYTGDRWNLTANVIWVRPCHRQLTTVSLSGSVCTEWMQPGFSQRRSDGNQKVRRLGGRTGCLRVD